MKPKNLLILLVVAAVLIGLAGLVSKRSERGMNLTGEIGKPVLPALSDPETLNKVEQIVFRSGARTVHVARVNEVWAAPDRYGYPMKFDRVHDFVRTLSTLKIGQVIPADAQTMQALELADPSSVTNGKAGTVVELKDASGTSLASLMVGKEHQKAAEPGSRFGGYPDGRYVAAGGRAYLVAETLNDIPDEDKDWLDDQICHVPSGDIMEIRLSDPDGKPVVLSRPKPTKDLTLAKLGRKEEMDTSKVNSVAGVLSYLRFSDVADPSLTDEQMGLDKPVLYTAMTKKGRVYTLKLGGKVQGKDDRYVRVSVELKPQPDEKEAKPAEDEAADKEKSPEEKKADEAAKKKKEAREKLEKETRELSARLAKWTYIVKPYKVDNAVVARDALVKEKGKDTAGKDEPVAAQKPDDDEKKGEKKKKGFFSRLFGGGDDDEADETSADE